MGVVHQSGMGLCTYKEWCHRSIWNEGTRLEGLGCLWYLFSPKVLLRSHRYGAHCGGDQNAFNAHVVVKAFQAHMLLVVKMLWAHILVVVKAIMSINFGGGESAMGAHFGGGESDMGAYFGGGEGDFEHKFWWR